MAAKPALQPVRWKAPARTARARERTGWEPVAVCGRIHLSGVGPEDVVAGLGEQAGQLFTGVQDGRILAVDLGTRAVRQVGKVEGRPLGLHTLPEGRLFLGSLHEDALLELDVPEK
ncbi:MAG TPA: hypothetical protein VGX23_22875 [Actinocrinis sp.]|nr:hypothetical protein [Actinocrinis sp.]